VVDLHCGDGNESLRPYAYWQVTGDVAMDEAGKQMALAFGLDHIVVDRERPADPARTMYTSNTAVRRGKPAITVESGGLGSTDEASVRRLEVGALSLMAHLRIRAPLAGEVLYVVATPPASEGEPLAFVGHVTEGEVKP
jgi:predicted deacylase